jgi:hypothetical protein
MYIVVYSHHIENYIYIYIYIYIVLNILDFSKICT